ncbi:MAG: TolC family protein [Methylococcaceae bacterium]|nr:TolC family protein [Methylococcaceae bacterium]
MTEFRHIKYSLPALLLVANSCIAEVKSGEPPRTFQEPAPIEKPSVEHIDPIEIDPALTLPQLIDQTLEKYPDRLINEALSQEADALKTRGESWFAGSTALALDYSDDRIASDLGSREASAKLEFTVWNWGQRSAAQNVAEQAHNAAQKQSAAVKLEVARLVRESLWDMAMAESRLQQAKYTVDISSQLLEKVRRRVELGDLARADQLLAETEHLQNRSLLTQAEAEMMHTRKAYASLTQTIHVPGNYQEQLSPISEIQATHPMLEAINTFIARKQASVEWAKSTDTINQPKVSIGAKNTRDMRGTDDMQSAGVGVVIPFGHSTYDAPEIAAAHLELNRALAQREHLQRLLEKMLHEAEHGLEVTREELKIATELKQIAETHLKMTETAFTAGEINLLDLLKIQARSLEAIRNAKLQEVKLQRNIAFYNQAVGVLP